MIRSRVGTVPRAYAEGMSEGRSGPVPGRRAGSARRPDAATLAAGSAVAALALLTGLVALLVRTGTLLVHACLPGDGVVGALGVRLALLGPGADCPEGTLGLTGEGAGAARLVVLVALPVVLGYVAAALAGVSTAVVVRAGRRALAACLAPLGVLRRHLPGAPLLVTSRPTSARVPERVDVLVGQVLGALVRRRGPPVLATV